VRLAVVREATTLGCCDRHKEEWTYPVLSEGDVVMTRPDMRGLLKVRDPERSVVMISSGMIGWLYNDELEEVQ